MTFSARVYEVARLIPFGRVTSYGAIARFIGTGRSARMVGWALNSATIIVSLFPPTGYLTVTGSLSGKHHFGNSTTMQQLLENEGLIVEDDRVLNFSEKFWDPSSELQ